MIKATILWVPALLLGWCSATTPAQAQEETPKKKITIVLKEGNGEPQVFEYNSEEEMQADERLKGRVPLMDKDRMVLPLREPDKGRLLLKEDHLLADSGNRLQQHRTLFFRRFKVDSATGDVLRMNVMQHRALVMEELPEEAQSLLREHGLAVKEGEKLMIVRELDKMPEPPLPPALPALPGPEGVPAESGIPGVPGVPPVPPVPPVVADGLAPAEALQWLEELWVYPNPASDQVQVRFRSASPGPAMLRLVDLNGKVVYEESIPDAGLTIDRTIKAPGGKKGVFILQLEQEGSKLSRRVLLH